MGNIRVVLWSKVQIQINSWKDEHYCWIHKRSKNLYTHTRSNNRAKSNDIQNAKTFFTGSHSKAVFPPPAALATPSNQIPDQTRDWNAHDHKNLGRFLRSCIPEGRKPHGHQKCDPRSHLTQCGGVLSHLQTEYRTTRRFRSVRRAAWSVGQEEKGFELVFRMSLEKRADRGPSFLATDSATHRLSACRRIKSKTQSCSTHTSTASQHEGISQAVIFDESAELRHQVLAGTKT